MKLNHILKPEEITYCKAEGDHTRLVLADKKEIVIKKRFNKVEKNLFRYNFARCHHSYIVNINHIEQIYPDKLILDGKTIPISRRKKTEFKKIIARKIVVI